jgi:hypothetical protein
VWPGGWDAEAASFTPAAIAGTWTQIEALLGEKIPSLTHAVIVLARSRDQLLTQADRDRLWRAFRVPIFEQILGEDGAVLAAECEAHDGLHVESPKLRVELTWLEAAVCGCGRNTPRIKACSHVEALRAVAAYAR